MTPRPLTSSLAMLVAGAAIAAFVWQGEAEDSCANVSRPAASAGSSLAGDPLREPQSMTPVSNQAWDRLTTNCWSYLRRTASKDADIVDDLTAPFSPPNVLRITFTPSMRRDTEPGVEWIGLPNVREVYSVWWIRLSPNWKSSPAGAGKMTFLHAAPNGQGQVYTAFFGSKPPHRVSVNTEWAPYGQRVWDPNKTKTPMVYDRWYRIEWYVKWASTPEADDGILRWWIDGALNGDYGNVHFPKDSVGFHQFEFAPTLQYPPPAEQHMYIDHTYVSGQ